MIRQFIYTFIKTFREDFKKEKRVYIDGIHMSYLKQEQMGRITGDVSRDYLKEIGTPRT